MTDTSPARPQWDSPLARLAEAKLRRDAALEEAEFWNDRVERLEREAQQ